MIAVLKRHSDGSVVDWQTLLIHVVCLVMICFKKFLVVYQLKTIDVR